MNTINDEKYSKIHGHYNCLLCGEHNRWGLALKFELLKDGRVHSHFKSSRVMQGYEGILHGGVQCALLDSAMVHCLFHNGIKAVTAHMNIRFVDSIPCTEEIDLYGELLEIKRPLFYMKSSIIYNGKTMAKADAKFMEIK